MAIRTEFDVEKVLDDYQHETGDESLLKYMGNDLFLPDTVKYEEDAVQHVTSSGNDAYTVGLGSFKCFYA